MTDTQAGKLTLAPDGGLHWQSDKTNPLPGDKVGTIAKGDHVLRPVAKSDNALLQDALTEALQAQIAVVLEPLALLQNQSEMPEVVKPIATRMYDAMGVVPREDMESLIFALDPDTRRNVRNLKIKLGPVIVFMPDLNKPAAVKLRALLWNVFHDLPLPAKTPNDGMVSLKVEDENADKLYYRTIGYPLYGPRAVRIDMLDRVINAIYDNAKDGKFQAKHEMAEWLGASIEDLYKVLEAMGHTRMADAPVAEKPAEEIVAAAPASEEAAPAEVKPEEPKVQAKPELATFRLKKGRASQAQTPRPERKPQAERPKFDNDKPKFKPKDKGEYKKKPFKKEERKKEERPREFSAGVKEHKPEDSPFAILQQLKAKK